MTLAKLTRATALWLPLLWLTHSATAADFPPSAVLVLPTSDIPKDTNLSFSLVDSGTNDTDTLFHATKIWITHENGTEMTSSQAPFGTATLGNATARPWDQETGEFSPLGNETVCRKPKGSSKPSVAKFSTISDDWPAAEYTIHLEEIVHHGSSAVAKMKDGSYCISPPFTNLTSMAEVKVTIADNSTKSAVSFATTSVAFPAPTGTGAGSSTLGASLCTRAAVSVACALAGSAWLLF